MKAFIFDFDGVIADTERTKFALVRALLQEHGHELEDHLYLQFIGTKRDYGARRAGNYFRHKGTRPFIEAEEPAARYRDRLIEEVRR